MKKYFLFLILFPILSSAQITFTIPVDGSISPISPYIYGNNDRNYLPDVGMNFQRQGGNRFTAYNWETNASNAGVDWQHSSDTYLGDFDIPGKVWSDFVEAGNTRNQRSIITLQMAGYVSADKNGSVSASEAAPSARWNATVAQKGSAFELSPNLTDNIVYMDEGINYLVNRFGTAAEGGVLGYALDNEPALWNVSHPRIQAAELTFAEYLDKSTRLCKAIKDVDPSAETFGGVLFGWGSFTTFNWADLGGVWFIDAYLDSMAQAEQMNGRRLLDVLDIHWYPEAKGDGQRIVFSGGTTAGTNEARIQAPRSLWDPDYTEDSWIAQWQTQGPIALLPDLKQRIETHYPGTKLAITEWDFGETGHWSGGLATADALGIYGEQGVYATAYWINPGGLQEFGEAAYRIYGNYDGAGARYGDQALPAITNDKDATSIHAALDSNNPDLLHIIAINKRSSAQNANFAIQGSGNFGSAKVYGFDENSSIIVQQSSVLAITANNFDYVLPARSVMHFVVQSSSKLPVKSMIRPASPNSKFSIERNGSSLILQLSVDQTGPIEVRIQNLQGKVRQQLSYQATFIGKVSILLGENTSAELLFGQVYGKGLRQAWSFRLP